jgi:D-alanine-D-alanine ligase
MASRPKTRLGILFGGKSGEHEVSITSAASVIEALDGEEFEITAIGITKSGRLAKAEEVRQMLPPSVRERIDPGSALAGPQSTVSRTSSAEAGASGPAPEIIFPLLHGPYGEDGTIQGLLEIAELPYIGSGVLASAVGMDKAVMKRLFIQEGLPVTPFRVLETRNLENELDLWRQDCERAFGFPLFSKPANLGSSVGICKIHSPEEFEEAVRHSALFDQKILIEKGIDARECECAVLGNEDPQVSVVGEIIPSREFYDYRAKYLDDASELAIPAPIPPEASDTIQDLTRRAFKTIEASGLARVDFFIERGTGDILINEINTMPGFTPISMYAKLWAASGIGFEDLIRRLIELGFKRFEERRNRRISMD